MERLSGADAVRIQKYIKTIRVELLVELNCNPLRFDAPVADEQSPAFAKQTKPFQKHRSNALQCRVFWPKGHSVDRPQVGWYKFCETIQSRHYWHDEDCVLDEA